MIFRWLKNTQIQWANRPHPDRVLGVIQQIVSGIGMQEHHQTLAVERQPRQHLAQVLWLEGQLATPVRVRTYRTFVHAPHP